MDQDGFVEKLEEWKREFDDEVIDHFRDGNEDRGRMAFFRWREHFYSFLKDYVPEEVNRLALLTSKYAAVAIRGETPFDRFMREDGNKYIAFIEELIQSVRKGRVKVRENTVRVQSNQEDLLRRDHTKATVAVITALEEELDYLLDMPFGWSGPLTQVDGITYREGYFPNGTKVLAISARSMGLVSTAILTAMVLKEWSPSIAAMIGVCGGRKKKRIDLGDIIVANQCFHYQFGAFEDGKFVRELRVENVNRRVTDIAENLKRTSVLSQLQNLPPRGSKKPKTVLECHIGPMASADLVVKDVEKFGDALDADRKTIAVDMESYAFMHAARLAGTPLSFVVKSVSDFADAEKNDDYREYAKLTATEFFKRIIEDLIKDS